MSLKQLTCTRTDQVCSTLLPLAGAASKPMAQSVYNTISNIYNYSDSDHLIHDYSLDLWPLLISSHNA